MWCSMKQDRAIDPVEKGNLLAQRSDTMCRGVASALARGAADGMRGIVTARAEMKNPGTRPGFWRFQS